MFLKIALTAATLAVPLAGAAQVRVWDPGTTEPDRILLPPYEEEVYGPNTGTDGTGRPYHWETQQGEPVTLPQVKPDVYGPGIGQDQYGRPVTRQRGLGR